MAVGVWTGGALLVLGRAAGRPGSLYRRGTWFFAGASAVGSVMNLASRSRWERRLWAPVAGLLAILCAIVGRSRPV